MTQSNGNLPKIYRIAPDYRRCLYYGIVSIPLLGAAGFLVRRFLGQPIGWTDVVPIIAILSAVELAFLVALSWKLLVDEHGIARKRLWWIDHWPWEVFASGRIVKCHAHGYRDSARPWWNRSLWLDYLADDDCKRLVARINEFYHLPPAPTVPETLTIRYGFRRTATFDHNGIHLSIRGRFHEHLWNELRRVRIVRVEPLRRDFVKLQVFLPTEQLVLRFVSHQGGRSPTWHGGEPELVEEFLRQHVPTDRITVDISGERPHEREDAEQMLADEKTQLRSLYWCFGCCTALLTATFVWMAVTEGMIKALLMFVPQCIIFVPVLVFFLRRMRADIAKVAAWVDAFDDARRAPRVTS